MMKNPFLNDGETVVGCTSGWLVYKSGFRDFFRRRRWVKLWAALYNDVILFSELESFTYSIPRTYMPPPFSVKGKTILSPEISKHPHIIAIHDTYLGRAIAWLRFETAEDCERWRFSLSNVAHLQKKNNPSTTSSSSSTHRNSNASNVYMRPSPFVKLPVSTSLNSTTENVSTSPPIQSEISVNIVPPLPVPTPIPSALPYSAVDCQDPSHGIEEFHGSEVSEATVSDEENNGAASIAGKLLRRGSLDTSLHNLTLSPPPSPTQSIQNNPQNPQIQIPSPYKQDMSQSVLSSLLTMSPSKSDKDRPAALVAAASPEPLRLVREQEDEEVDEEGFGDDDGSADGDDDASTV